MKNQVIEDEAYISHPRAIAHGHGAVCLHVLGYGDKPHFHSHPLRSKA